MVQMIFSSASEFYSRIRRVGVPRLAAAVSEAGGLGKYSLEPLLET